MPEPSTNGTMRPWPPSGPLVSWPRTRLHPGAGRVPPARTSPAPATSPLAGLIRSTRPAALPSLASGASVRWRPRRIRAASVCWNTTHATAPPTLNRHQVRQVGVLCRPKSRDVRPCPPGRQGVRVARSPNPSPTGQLGPGGPATRGSPPARSRTAPPGRRRSTPGTSAREDGQVLPGRGHLGVQPRCARAAPRWSPPRPGPRELAMTSPSHTRWHPARPITRSAGSGSAPAGRRRLLSRSA